MIYVEISTNISGTHGFMLKGLTLKIWKAFRPCFSCRYHHACWSSLLSAGPNIREPEHPDTLGVMLGLPGSGILFFNNHLDLKQESHKTAFLRMYSREIILRPTRSVSLSQLNNKRSNLSKNYFKSMTNGMRWQIYLFLYFTYHRIDMKSW